MPINKGRKIRILILYLHLSILLYEYRANIELLLRIIILYRQCGKEMKKVETAC